MIEIKKLSVFSFAKFQSVLFGLLGLIAGILYSFGGLFIDIFVSIGWYSTTETPGLSFGTILAFGALVGMPIIFAGFGFILGILEAILFNSIGRKIPGIKIDYE